MLALCILIGLNWWMKPITKVAIELRSYQPKKFYHKLSDAISHCLIRYEPLKAPPRFDLVDETPTSSVAEDEEYLMTATKYEKSQNHIADIKL